MVIGALGRGRRVLEQASQQRNELGPDRVKLLQMIGRKSVQVLLACPSDLDQHLGKIVRGFEANQETALGDPVDESHGAVMLELHSLR